MWRLPGIQTAFMSVRSRGQKFSVSKYKIDTQIYRKSCSCRNHGRNRFHYIFLNERSFAGRHFQHSAIVNQYTAHEIRKGGKSETSGKILITSGCSLLFITHRFFPTRSNSNGVRRRRRNIIVKEKLTFFIKENISIQYFFLFPSIMIYSFYV